MTDQRIALRDKINEKLSDQQLLVFCFYHFRGVYDDLSGEWSKQRKIQELIGYCERHGLLAELEERLEQYEPHLTGVPANAVFTGVPTMPNHFVGREELVAGLVQQLVSGQSVALAAEGQPGVGKTTTAVALAYHPQVRAHFSDGVLWGGLGRVPDVMSILAAWAEALGGDVTDRVEPEIRSQAVSNLIGQKRLLLVIDDAWRPPENALLLRCGGPNCGHVLTTRNRSIARKFAGPAGLQNVQPLAAETAFELLQRLAPAACATDPVTARGLAEAVGGLPLALELLAGYLVDENAPERMYFPEATREALAALSVPEQRLQLAARRLGGGSEAVTLPQTIEWSLEELEPEAQAAFYGLGAFAPKPASFSREAARVVAAAEARTLSVLLERKLLDVNGERLALHQTLAEAAAAKLLPEARTRHQSYYVALANEDRQDWRRIERNYEQMTWAWRQAAETPESLELVWALRVYQERRGMWQDYLAWADRGLTICQINGLREDEGTLLNNIGVVYDRLGQRERALEYKHRALPISEEVGDRYGESITRYNMAMIFWGDGHLPEAAAELRKVVELDRLVQNPNLADHLATLAQVEAELRAKEL